MTETIWLVVAAVAGLGLLALVIYLLWRRQNPKVPSGTGRGANLSRALAPMRGFARSNQYRFIAPATITSGGQTAQLDAVVVGYFGVMGLISLGYNGQVYGAPNDKEWVQVDGKDKRTPFENPMTQASATVRVLRDVLMQAKAGKKVPVEVVCVFTAPDVQLALPRSTGHLRVKEFKKLLGKEKYREDCGLDLDAVEAALKAAVLSTAAGEKNA